jgi:transposase
VSRKRSSFSPEFKDELVKLYLQERSKKTVAQVAREHGVGPETFRNWVKVYESAHPAEEEPLTVSERARLRELERENRELKLEKEFLSKAAAFCVSRVQGALSSGR